MNRLSTRPQLRARWRSGFTLVEILVSIVISGIIAGMLAVAITGANEQAKEARAKTLVARLNSLILQIYETETARGVDAPTSTLQLSAVVPGPNSRAGKSRALAILNWQRDYLRCALPDRRHDLIDPPIDVYYNLYRGTGGTAQIRTARVDPTFNPPDPPLPSTVSSWATEFRNSTRWANQLRYRDRIFAMVKANSPSPPADFGDCVDGNVSNGEWTAEHQGAECLYLIMATHLVQGIPASDSLRGRDIGDLDEDGIPEVLDPWGAPVGFLRWPCGYQLLPEWEGTITNPELATRKQELGKDPLDILYSDPRYDDTSSADYQADDPYPLIPMVVLAGTDGVFDLVGLDEPPATPIRYALGNFPILPNGTLPFPNPPGPSKFIDPYQYNTPVPDQLGARRDTADLRTDNSGDNIYPSF